MAVCAHLLLAFFILDFGLNTMTVWSARNKFQQSILMPNVQQNAKKWAYISLSIISSFCSDIMLFTDMYSDLFSIDQRKILFLKTSITMSRSMLVCSWQGYSVSHKKHTSVKLSTLYIIYQFIRVVWTFHIKILYTHLHFSKIWLVKSTSIWCRCINE